MVQMLKNCFGKAEVNTGRQPELDLAKGFAIIFMVWVHVYETLCWDEGIGGVIVDSFLGSPFAAPIFMICMGIGMAYVKKDSPADFARRGMHILIVGFLLDIVRSGIPALVEYLSYPSAEGLSWLKFSMISVDIMQFAGLAFLFMALMKKIGANRKVMVAVAAACSLLGAVLRYKTTGNDMADGLLGYIWGTDMNDYFPFLNWIIFPAFGYAFAWFLRRCNDKGRFYKLVSPVGFAAGMTYLILAYRFGFGMYGENSSYYFLGPIDVIFILMLALGIFGIDYFLLSVARTWPAKTLIKALQSLAANINTVYCIHWTLIAWALPLVWYVTEDVGFWPMSVLAACILISSGFLAKAWVDFRNNTKQKRTIVASMNVR